MISPSYCPVLYWSRIARVRCSLLPLLPRCRRPFSISLRTLCPDRVARNTPAETTPLTGTINQTTSKPQRTSGLSALRGRGKVKGEKSTRDLTRRTILGQSPDLPIRTRFAPSPTGYLHLGSLRTALFNNLTSIGSNGGSFILRIEDTDQNRLVQDAEDRIIQDLKWLGLSWEEGPDCGGPHGPYRQSERLDIYTGHVKHLVDGGHAYRCFCDPEHLDAQRRQQYESGEPTVYQKTCRSIDATESDRRAASGEPHVVRFKGDAFGNLSVRDAVYGHFQKKDVEEDFIIMKTDGYPTYHLANVVDDHLMQITHVIRGEEWLISTPKHLALYAAFGWTPPTFAHLGLLVNDDGSKLSKRQSSANVSTYREQHVSPMALQPWLASLGSSFMTPVNTVQTIPRKLEDVANALSFKFTRGSIRLNMSKLDNFEANYRRAIMSSHASQSSPELHDQEAQLIKDVVLHPTLDEILSLTKAAPAAGFVDPAWEQPKELVPALAADQNQALRKLWDVYWWLSESGSTTTLQGMKGLLLNHPYLFWRVPTDLYRRSLALDDGSCFSQPVLDALQSLCNKPPLWPTHVWQPSNINAPLVQMISAECPSHKSATYTTHRLVMAGMPRIPSPSVDFLSRLLGADESKRRVAVVQGLVGELRDGGDAVRQRWLDEAWERYPEFMQEKTPSSATP